MTAAKKSKPRRKRKAQDLRALARNALERNVKNQIARTKAGKVLTAQGKAELEAIASGHKDGDVPAYASQREMAGIIKATFELECNAMAVNRWIHEDGAPPAGDNGKLKVGDFLEWVRVKKLHRGSGGDGQEDLGLLVQADEASARLKIREDERHLFEFELLKGAYEKRSDRDRILGGWSGEWWNLYWQFFENDYPRRLDDKLRDAGMPDDQRKPIVAAAVEAGKQHVDALQEKFSKKAAALASDQEVQSAA